MKKVSLILSVILITIIGLLGLTSCSSTELSYYILPDTSMDETYFKVPIVVKNSKMKKYEHFLDGRLAKLDDEYSTNEKNPIYMLIIMPDTLTGEEVLTNKTYNASLRRLYCNEETGKSEIAKLITNIDIALTIEKTEDTLKFSFEGNNEILKIKGSMSKKGEGRKHSDYVIEIDNFELHVEDMFLGQLDIVENEPRSFSTEYCSFLED